MVLGLAISAIILFENFEKPSLFKFNINFINFDKVKDKFKLEKPDFKPMKKPIPSKKELRREPAPKVTVKEVGDTAEIVLEEDDYRANKLQPSFSKEEKEAVQQLQEQVTQNNLRAI